MKPFLTAIFLTILMAFSGFQANATHIVGGEVTYKYIGHFQYQIQIDIYQDCIAGDPNAIAQDNPAYVAIFDGNGLRLLTDSIYASSKLRIPDNFSNSCINNKPNICLTKVSFIKTYEFDSTNKSGFYVVYQRCCRNGSILNLINPSGVGATNYAFIPPLDPSDRMFNNSAVFNNYPPQIICINNPLFYDHSAIDIDQDSLSYEFCTAYNGGAANNAKPMPNSINFQPLKYLWPYSAQYPMGQISGISTLKIDPKTGMITGTPTQIGRYVVTVCCHEWRNGVIINTVTREFQFVVTNCSKAVVANIPQLSELFNTYIVICKGYTVHFKNISTGANSEYDAYSWDFGVNGINSDTSHAKEPEYTYPDTGTYLVKLVVNRNSTCADSISRFVKVYPDFEAEFLSTGLPCPLVPIQFTNTSRSTYKPINYYDWDFGDNNRSNLESPSHVYDSGGIFKVILRSKNIMGCYDTVTHNVTIERFHPFAGNDTVIVKGESIYFNATGGSVYTWTPNTYLNNPNIYDPIGYYPDTGKFVYVIHIASEGGCEGNDTVQVLVVNQSAIFVPSAFSPNGDGKNDVLRPIGVGYRNINYFRVFNRWGQQVYYGTRFMEGWDGTYQGHIADIGTYFWVLSINDRFGKEVLLKGDSALIQ